MVDKEKNEKRNEMVIDIFDILRDLRKDIWLILLFGISVAMCSYVVAHILYKPSYSVNVTYVVTAKGYNNIYKNLSTANTVAQTMTSIFSSNILENKIASDIGSATIPGTVKAKAITSTNLFDLTVSSSSPKLAYRILTSIMKNYTSVTSDVFENAVLNVLAPPELPTGPDHKLNSLKIMQWSFFIAAAAMTALLTGLSVIRDTIKNEDEVMEKLDTKLFGVVYHENKYKTIRSRIRKAKKSILITSPSVSFSFVESIRKMRAKIEYKAASSGGNVLLVTSVLENEGKSTIATNLALALAQRSFKVLVIDADFYNPSVYKILQKEEQNEQEIGECIKKLSDLKNALMYDEESGLHLLLGRRLYKNASDLIAGETFQKLIQVAKKIMDYIIIDVPPITTSADAEILADIADHSLLVVRQSTAMTKSINDAIDILAASKSELLGCVYNNVYKNMAGHRLEYGSKYGYRHYYGGYGRKETAGEGTAQVSTAQMS